MIPIWFLFALGEPSVSAPAPLSGTISVATVKASNLPKSLEGVFVSAVGQAFSDRGFTALDGVGHARYAAEIKISRDNLGTTSAAVSKSGTGLRSGENSSVVGAGISFALPTGKSRSVPLERTRLEISVHREGEGVTLWSGAAVTVRPGLTQKGSIEAVARDLSNALLREYPEQSAEAISVP